MTEQKPPNSSHEATEDDNDSCVLAEYESKFKDIDSKLEDIRSEFAAEAATTATTTTSYELDDDDDEDHDVSSLNVSSLKASLAEESAAHMEEIVKTLKAQREESTTQQEEATEKEETTAKENNSTSTPKSETANKSSNNRWLVVFSILVPTILSVFLAWKLHIIGTTTTQSEPVILQQPTIQYREKVTRQACRYINGQQYCESDERSRATAANNNGASNNNAAGGRQTYYQSKQCRYVNGQSYCESYEQEHSGGGSASSNGGYNQIGDE